MSPINLEFDCYLMVDWCAESKPKTRSDSIWYCFYDRPENVWKIENPATRKKATDEILVHLHEKTKQQRAVLVGFDFPFGYPAGFSSALGLVGKHPWRAIWDELKKTVIDDDKNRNNRFDVAAAFNCRISSHPFPFWGRPKNMESRWISQTKARPHLAEFRITEQRAKGTQSVWKLLGQGCVGSQAIVGIPCVARLRDDEKLCMRSAVWPFETGLRLLPKRNQREWSILYAEIFPPMFKATARRDEIRDEAQVRDLVERLKAEDEGGRLGEWFAGPNGLNKQEKRRIVTEEGWILGLK
jgi:hypothetical protein